MTDNSDIQREIGSIEDLKEDEEVGSPIKRKKCEEEQRDTAENRTSVAMDMKNRNKRLNGIYNLIKQSSDLFYGVDKDIDDVSTGTQGDRKARSEEYESAVPESVSAGYGEILKGSFSKIISTLKGESFVHGRNF